MKIWGTRGDHQVFRLMEGRSNVFLVRNGDKYLCIDTGLKARWADFQERLELLMVGEENLAAVICTHTHYDHVENAAALKAKFGCPIIVHRLEAERLRSGHSSFPAGSIVLTKWMTDKARMLGLLPAYGSSFKGVEPDIEVDDDYDLQELGFNAQIIHTPGHSDGSISVIIDGEIAVVGDAMFGVIKDSIFPPFADNPRQMVTSWNRLLQTGCSLYLPAHGMENKRSLVKKEWNKFSGIYKIEIGCQPDSPSEGAE